MFVGSRSAQIFQQMGKVSDRARKAGIELDRTQQERSKSWVAKRHFRGNEVAAAARSAAKKRFFALMEKSGGCGASEG